jgi:hypothetical protein
MPQRVVRANRDRRRDRPPLYPHLYLAASLSIGPRLYRAASLSVRVLSMRAASSSTSLIGRIFSGRDEPSAP